MRTYKSQKTTASWKSCRLKDFCEKRTAKNVDKKYNSVLTNSAIYGVIKQEEYFEKEVANDENTGTYYIVNPKDFIYNPRISENAPYGPIRANETGEAGIVSPLYFVFGISDSTGVDYDFLKYYFTSSNWHRYIYSIGNNGARCDRMNIADADFMNMTINLPPLAEQKRIAEILGCCDRMIALKKELIAEKKRQKKALMQKLLNPDSGFRLPGFTGEWNSIKLENCGHWIGGGTPSKQNRSFWENGTIKWISSQEVKTRLLVDTTYKITKKAIEVSASNIVPKNSLIFVSRSGVLKHSFPVAKIIEPMAINQDIKALTPCETIEIDFLHFLMESHESDIIKNYVTTGTTVESLRFDDFIKMLVNIPCKKEQQAIADILSAADKEIDLLEQELTQQQQKKKSLMQLLLTGIVRV